MGPRVWRRLVSLRAHPRLPPGATLVEDFITAQQESALLDQVDPLLRRRGYQERHFDGVIAGYREVERPREWFVERGTIDRVVHRVFGDTPPDLLPVHVLDLKAGPEGHIRHHIDHVDYSGEKIGGLSLGSAAIMSLRHRSQGDEVHMLLRARSLYCLQGPARYEWEHGILPTLLSEPASLAAAAHGIEVEEGGGLPVEPSQEKGRRVVLVFRDAPRG